LSFHADKKVYNENGNFVKEIVMTSIMPFPGYAEDKTEIKSGTLNVTITSHEAGTTYIKTFKYSGKTKSDLP
jgi:hypothetical protein